ncbi:MAG: hypothetical protein H6641_16175 [Caldilineaceae bacterium]|nr:hypothetical protein [Caldilineaceae bacterium]
MAEAPQPDLDEELDAFAPTSFSINAPDPITDTRVITITLVWQDVNPFAQNEAYSHALILNDSTESKYGPGVFLDPAASIFGIPNYEPITPIDRTTWFVQSRLGDFAFEKRFGITFTQANQFLPDTDYTFAWVTPPGSAETDNADIELSLSTKLTSSCNLRICLRTHIRCRPNSNQWNIDPIPGIHILRKPFQDCRDLNLLHLFPLIRH